MQVYTGVKAFEIIRQSYSQTIFQQGEDNILDNVLGVENKNEKIVLDSILRKKTKSINTPNMK